MDLEWDGNNVAHIRRHRVQPHEAEEAMGDPYQSPVPATNVNDEEREGIIGLTGAGRLLVVYYTLRDERFRVVTARPATVQEARLYWKRR